MSSYRTLAVDPGNEESGWVLFDGSKVLDHGIEPNDQLVDGLMRWANADHLAIEMIASYGMSVGADIFQTCVWVGRFIEAWRGHEQNGYTLVYRKDVKMHLCGDLRAKDANIRQALIDRFGPGKPRAIGTKKTPGPLYGIRKHEWQALAVAVTYHDRAVLERMAI